MIQIIKPEDHEHPLDIGYFKRLGYTFMACDKCKSIWFTSVDDLKEYQLKYPDMILR